MNWTDASGREWEINLSLGLIENIAKQTKLDLAPADSDMRSLCNLKFEHRLLAEVLYLASKCELDRQDFASALDGEALKCGWTALKDAVLDYYSGLYPEVGKILSDAIDNEFKIKELGLQKVSESMDTMMSAASLDEIAQQIESQMRSIFKDKLSQVGKDAKRLGTDRR